MHRMLIALIVALSLLGCTSPTYTIPSDPPTPKPATPSKPRLLEQDISQGDYRIPVFHATETEFYTYRTELLLAPPKTQRAVAGIICYATDDDALDRVLLSRIKDLYGETMATECGGPAAHHWSNATVTHCFLGNAPIPVVEAPTSRGANAGVVAHCHSNGVICIIASKYYPGVMRHEAFHALSFAQKFDENKRWRLAWLETLYVGKAWSSLSRKSGFPRDGFVDAYATKHYDEDMADVVEASYLFAHRDALNVLDPYLGTDLADPRFKLKVRTVYGFGAITDEECRVNMVRLTAPP